MASLRMTLFNGQFFAGTACSTRSRCSNSKLLPSGDGTEHDKGLLARRDGIGQRSIGGVMREVLLAGEEAQKGAALQCAVVANGPAQHRILCLKRIEDGADRHRTMHLELHLAI